MGQKVNPHGLRVGVIKDWDSRWYARNDKVGDLLVEDYNIRKDLKKRLYSAGIAKIEIERSNARVKINLHCSRPGVVIGKAGLTEFFGQLCCVALALGEDALHIQIMPGAQGISHVVNTLAAVRLAGRGIDNKNMFHKTLRYGKE